MARLVTAAAALIAVVALLLASVPSLRFWTTAPLSKEALHIRALAAGQDYTSTIVLQDPLVLYVDDFLSAQEIDDILNATGTTFAKSNVYNPDPNAVPTRNSSSCVLPEDHMLHAVVAARAEQFLITHNEQLSEPISYYGIENVQLVKYHTSQYYHFHVDWFGQLRRDDLPGKGTRGKGRGQLYNRVASFFLYLKDDCEGGGTQFPDLDPPSITDFWRQRIVYPETPTNTESDLPGGLSFRPRKGSGVFWVNLLPEGYGDDRVRHAGLPVTSGEKIGMNIWVKRSFGW